MKSATPPPIQIKAVRDRFILAPDLQASFAEITRYLEKRLQESNDFFYHSAMCLDLSKRPLDTDQIRQLQKLLAAKAGVRLVEIKIGEGLVYRLQDGQERPRPITASAESPKPDLAPMIVRGTCRSGTLVESPADCVVLGDVNPGAEVIAVKDIIVFGRLRGVAHAGAAGDRSARIWTLSMEPSQLRIADLVALPPRGGKPIPKRFEVAEIQDNMIQVITL